MVDRSGSVLTRTVWTSVRRNPHRIAVALFALMLIGFVVNAIAFDTDTTTFPTAVEADGDVPSPRAAPATSNRAGLVAGFGLFGLWAVLGIVAFTRPNRTRSTRPATEEPVAGEETGERRPDVSTGDPSLN
jgi:hypothetical protein